MPKNKDYQQAKKNLAKARADYQKEIKRQANQYKVIKVSPEGLQSQTTNQKSLASKESVYLQSQIDFLNTQDNKHEKIIENFLAAKEMRDKVQAIASDPAYQRLAKLDNDFHKAYKVYETEMSKAAGNTDKQAALNAQMSELKEYYTDSTEELYASIPEDKRKIYHGLNQDHIKKANKDYKHARVEMKKNINEILYKEKFGLKQKDLKKAAFIMNPAVGLGFAAAGLFKHAKNQQQANKQMDNKNENKKKFNP